eukprot:jgi/Tetstr1/439022/TSEL_027514.t1
MAPLLPARPHVCEMRLFDRSGRLLVQVGGPEAAMFDYARGGPQWGACVLIIEPPQAPGMGGMSGPDSPTSDGRRGRPAAKSTSNGQAYETVPDEYADCSSFGGSAVEAKLREVQRQCQHSNDNDSKGGNTSPAAAKNTQSSL